jgi:hypothetical protein
MSSLSHAHPGRGPTITITPKLLMKTFREAWSWSASEITHPYITHTPPQDQGFFGVVQEQEDDCVQDQEDDCIQDQDKRCVQEQHAHKMLQKGLINLESSNQHSSNHHIISPTNFIRYLTQPTTFDDEAYFGSIIPSPSRRCSCRLWLSQHPRRSDRNRSGTQVASKSEGFFLSSLQ